MIDNAYNNFLLSTKQSFVDIPLTEVSPLAKMEAL